MMADLEASKKLISANTSAFMSTPNQYKSLPSVDVFF
jgi:hypothetical protein